MTDPVRAARRAPQAGFANFNRLAYPYRTVAITTRP